jgi:hypothetical protein
MALEGFRTDENLGDTTEKIKREERNKRKPRKKIGMKKYGMERNKKEGRKKPSCKQLGSRLTNLIT